LDQFRRPLNDGGWIPWSVLAFGLAVFGVMTGVIVIYLGRTAVVIDIQDPGVEVAVKGTTLTVTGPDKQSVKVVPGDQELTITCAGLETITKSFSLKKGDKKTVTVSIVDSKLVAQLENEIAPLTAAHEEKPSSAGPSGKGPSPPPTPAHDAPTTATLPRTFKNSLGMEFVLVPKGKSWLGGGGGKPGDKEVEIAQNFYLGKYEVTQEEWAHVTGQTPSCFSRTGSGKDQVKDISNEELKRFPVEQVSWDHAQLFLQALNEREKEVGWQYRLPKEAEWEYACRGGPTSTKFDSAYDFYLDKPTNQLLSEQANFWHDSGLKRTCKVGSYQPNRLGLYDMHGNAHEWCDDTEKTADGASRRVHRGGGWNANSGDCRAAGHGTYPPSGRDGALGLRVARVPVRKEVVKTPTEEKKPAEGPEEYWAKFDTTKGDVIIEVHRDWSPYGADRFYELVKSGFYDQCKFFRVAGFVAQFGISGDPPVSAKWHGAYIPDDQYQSRDSNRQSNKRGYVTFAKTGSPNSRTTQIFINRVDNARLDRQGFTPFGVVLSGMQAIDSLYSEYGEEPTSSQDRMEAEGDAYFNAAFPKFDSIKMATILPNMPEEAKKGAGDAATGTVKPDAPEVAIKSSNANDSFAPLFNGKDATGWKTNPVRPGNWRVESGVLVGSGPGASYLYSERGDFADFELHVESRINNGGNSGVYFRAPFGPIRPSNDPNWLEGYEAQINCTGPDVNRTGSLYAIPGGAVVAYPDSIVPPGEWFKMDIVAKGNHIVIKVNGTTTVDYTDPKRRTAAGHIALQQHDPQTVVEFRKIEIKELSPISASTAAPSAPAVGPKPNVATTASKSLGRPFLLRGEWTVENDEIVQPTLATGDERPLVVFGEETLSNYDLSLEAKKTGGSGQLGVLFHWLGPGYYRAFYLVGNREIGFSYHYNGIRGQETGNQKGLSYSSNRWYSLKIEARGDTFRAYLDGVLQFEQTDARFAHGRICLYTANAAARFRRIKVSDPQGKVLFEGLPELPPASDKTNPKANIGQSSRVLTAGETAAKSAQKQWVERLKTPVISTNSLGMKLALIPPGEFQMGSPNSERQREGNEQQHRVRITKPFYLGVYEITQSEFQNVMGRNPSRFLNGGGETEAATGVDTSRNPVENVNWYDAVEFCNKLSEKEGRRPYYGIAGIARHAEGWIKDAQVSVEGGGGYRLPTEAQWEYACRAGTTTPFNFGTANNGRESNCNGKAPYGTEEQGPALGRTVPVGSYRPNAFGLYDMHGNVGEWCWDVFDEAYYKHSPESDPAGPSRTPKVIRKKSKTKNSPASDPAGPSGGSLRVVRDGGWPQRGAVHGCRSAARHGDLPGHRYNDLGFRVARSSGE